MKRSFLISSLSLVLLAAFAVHGFGQSAKRTGEISKLDAAAKSFMIKTARGETNVTTTDATAFKEGSKTLKFADLKVGDHVVVDGERKGDNVEAKEVVREAGHEHPM